MFPLPREIYSFWRLSAKTKALSISEIRVFSNEEGKMSKEKEQRKS